MVRWHNPRLGDIQRFCMVARGSNIKNKRQTSRFQVCEIVGIDGATTYETGQWDVTPFWGVRFPKAGAIFTRTFVVCSAIYFQNDVNIGSEFWWLHFFRLRCLLVQSHSSMNLSSWISNPQSWEQNVSISMNFPRLTLKSEKFQVDLGFRVCWPTLFV